MKLKDKIKSYSFWVSLASAIILILKILGNRFGFVIDETMVSDLFTALCSILVLLGIIVPPQNTQNTSSIDTKNQSSKNELVLNNSVQDFESIIQNNIEHHIENKETVVSNDINKLDSVKQEQIEIIEDDSSNIQEHIECIEILDNQKETNQELNNTQSIEEDKTDVYDLKQMFFDIKEKFSGNLDSYIFELQEEIRKTREGM